MTESNVMMEFTIEDPTGDFNPFNLARDIYEALHDDWKNTDNDEYAIVKIGTPASKQTGVLERRLERLRAQLDNEQKVIAHLYEEQDKKAAEVANLQRCNGNQSDTINAQADRIKNLNHRVESLLNERRTLESRLDDQLVEWKTIQKQRDAYKNERDSFNHQIGSQVRTIAAYQELVNQKNDLIRKLRGRWGDDESLTYLERHAEAIKGEIDEVLAELDGIRTER